VRSLITLRNLLVCCFIASSAIAADSERHHALIVGVSQYSQASGAQPLKGVPKDMATSRNMALAMGVPDRKIIELRDKQATKTNILAALESMNRIVSPGEKVFIYFSGHGTSYSTKNGCEQGFIPFTDGPYTHNDIISEAELAGYTSKISQKADKAIVMVDACFSGGIVSPRTRSISPIADIRAKFVTAASDKCDVAVNQTVTRSFTPAMQRLGIPQENFVQISAANYNEVSWDNERLGGLATHTLGQCLLGDAKDINRSGSITLEEVRQCAQFKLNEIMAPHKAKGMLPSTIQMRGARNLIVVQAPPKPIKVAAVTPPVEIAEPISIPSAPTEAATPEKPPSTVTTPNSALSNEPLTQQVITQVAAVPTQNMQALVPAISQSMIELPAETLAEQLTASAATLEDIYAQRNGRLKLEVTAPKKLVIGKDPFAFNVRSSTNGYLYAVMLGSDGKSFYLLYPNKLDQDNKIKANITYKFPRPGWSINAAGPEGTNRMLFVVSQSPRDPKIFETDEVNGGGPFAFTLAEMTARKRLVDFFIGRGVQGKNGQMAATLVSVEEIR
jgi:hypothetical protein